MLTRIRAFLEMIRFSHTVFALPFALLSALLAWQEPPEGSRHWPIQLVGILLCMVFARSAAMAFNRLVDRKLDALNPRTAGRHIPAGLLSAGQVTFFALACSAGFIASTLLFLPNRLPLYLAVPVLAFLCGYSYAKRFTSLAHFWLGTALSLAPICAWVALRGDLGWPPVVLSAAVLLWVSGFDIIYACQDQAFDIEHALHSVPARLGTVNALRLAAVCHSGVSRLVESSVRALRDAGGIERRLRSSRGVRRAGLAPSCRVGDVQFGRIELSRHVDADDRRAEWRDAACVQSWFNCGAARLVVAKEVM